MIRSIPSRTRSGRRQKKRGKRLELWNSFSIISLEMNSIARKASSSLRMGELGWNQQVLHRVQQWRGIRVKVRDGNLEQALAFMQRKMQSSGVDRLLKNEPRHHLKNSEKRVLAQKRLRYKIQSEDLARKLKSILIQKVRGL